MDCTALKINDSKKFLVCTSIFFATVITATTLIAVGILGATGVIHMPPIGARIIIGLGVTFLLALVLLAVELASKN